MSHPIKGRATNITTHNKFEKHQYHEWKSDYEHLGEEEFYRNNTKTTFLETSPKTIVNTVKSPDIPFYLSMNPYQGCEHGCIYCYARDSHQYWGYNTGLDFERKILVKKNAPKLLDKTLSKKNWVASPIMLSGNTDCYQPCEKEYEITREILKVFIKHKHPVSIITKNALIERDIDLLEELASNNLVQVNYTLTSLDNKLKNLLEPRVSSVHKKLKVLESLTQHNIPVNIMMAPIIPALNSSEIFDIAKETSKRGATSMTYTLVRLNNDLGTLFDAWLTEHFPDRKDKILNQIKEIHGGTLNNSNYKERMTGQGIYAKQINALVNTAKRKYFNDKKVIKLNTELYGKFKNGQLSLF